MTRPTRGMWKQVWTISTLREAIEELPVRAALSGKEYEEAAVEGFISRKAVLELVDEYDITNTEEDE